MKYIDVFTGIGGISLALQRCDGMVCKEYVEINKFAQGVLRARMKDGQLQEAKISNDIRDVLGRAEIDFVAGGFPCQDVSGANHQRRGMAGERTSLVHELLRVAAECDATWIFLENVNSFTTNGFPELKKKMEEMNYTVRHIQCSAMEAGLRHRRRRIFILARKNNKDRKNQPPYMPNLYEYDVPEPAERTITMDQRRELGTRWTEEVKSLGNAAAPIQCDLALRLLLGNAPPGTSWDNAWFDYKQASVIKAKEENKCPTPLASECLGGSGPNRKSSDGLYLSSFSLARWVRMRPLANQWGTRFSLAEYESRLKTNYLKPNWLEWLMSFPQNWVKHNEDFKQPRKRRHVMQPPLEKKKVKRRQISKVQHMLTKKEDDIPAEQRRKSLKDLLMMTEKTLHANAQARFELVKTLLGQEL